MKYDYLKSSIKTIMEQRYELHEEGRPVNLLEVEMRVFLHDVELGLS